MKDLLCEVVAVGMLDELIKSQEVLIVDRLVFDRCDMIEHLNAKGIKGVEAAHLAIRYAKRTKEKK